jgi:hypothetical protein
MKLLQTNTKLLRSRQQLCRCRLRSCAIGSAAAASGGCAANPTGSTKQAGSTTSPLAAALVLKDKYIKSLYQMSQPFLTPLATSVLSKFATAYYADKKHKETKSDQNYISKAVKVLGFPLQGLPEVEQSKGFKALRNDFTIDLEKFRKSIMQNYIFKVKDLNVEAKKHQFHIAICKLLRGLATIYIAQCGIVNHPEDVAIANFITAKNDTVLVPLNMDLKKFLKAYMKAHGIKVFPKPTINNNIADLIDKVNGTPRIDPPANDGDAAPQDQAEGVAAEGAAADDERTQDDEMIEATKNAKIVGGRAAITCHIFDAAVKCIFEPIQLFHKTRLENEAAKQIKAAITLPRLSNTAQRVAQVIASERPAERPVLGGLIQETANKIISNIEKRILSLESK